jgi:hypothetical protein
MKIHNLALSAIALGMVSVANATIYTDAAGDQWSPNPHMDISQFEITNTATDITFKFSLSGSPLGGANWGKYLVSLRSNTASGNNVDTSTTNNAWGRNATLVGGASAYIGSWADGNPSQAVPSLYSNGWNQSAAGSTSNITATDITYTVSLASLGLAVGNTFVFDAFTSGGGVGDTANDSLTGGTPTSWTENVQMNGRSYTVVPEPATMSALALGAVALLRRRRSSK